MTSLYETDMCKAARRNWTAAETLNTDQNRSVAGYLYGLAAECAVKHHMQTIGLPGTKKRSDSPYFKHFPELKTVLKDHIQGRQGSQLQKYCLPQFMQDWDLSMRYSDGKAVTEQRVQMWKTCADQVLAESP